MKNLATALIKAQREMAPLLKDKKGNFGLYSTLASVQDVCLPALGNAGIAVFQSVHTQWEGDKVHVCVSCKLVHAESGEELENLPFSLMPTKTDPQSIGSAITYARRYILMAMAGIAPEDDDGNAGSGVTGQAAQKPQTQRPAQPPPVENKAPGGNGHEATKSAAFKQFMAEGTLAFDNEWTDARHWIINKWTNKESPANVRTSANDLTDEELKKLTALLKASTKWFKDEWNKQKAQPVTA